MKIRNLIPIIVVLLCFSVYGKDLSTKKNNNKLIKAILSNDLLYISNAFAPNFYFQYIIPSKYDKSELVNFRNSKGSLYNTFYNSTYCKNSISPNTYCLKEVFTKTNHFTFISQEDDTHFLSTITSYYKNYFYDIILNSNNKGESEIVGINITPASNLYCVSSCTSLESTDFIQLKTRNNLEASRNWHMTGIPQLSLNKSQSENLWGPNRPFTVLNAGTENGYGGIVYILTADSIIMLQHLTAINSKVMDGFHNRNALNPGTFIGSGKSLIGIAENNSKTYITIQGRSIAGSLLTSEEIIRILSGK